MTSLEQLTTGANVKGLAPNTLARIITVEWFGDQAVKVTFEDGLGRVAQQLVYRADELRLEIVESGRPWSFDGDGNALRLVSEAYRIRLAYLFDPYLAIHTSRITPLPHQITAVYSEMLARQPLRFLLADDPGAGKTIMAGLLIKELAIRGDLDRCLIVAPGGLVEQWQDELAQKFGLAFDIRALDTAERLCLAIGAADQAEELKKLRIEAQRTVYAEEARSQTRTKTLTLEGEPQKGLKPWREIVTPHKDVASGRYQQAEFAADLAQVHKNEGADEYKNPVEFFRRTFLTEGLKHLLTSAMLRLANQGGDPVVELQTNFGGGKTHSMLALYHLVGSDNGLALPGVEDLAKTAGVAKLPKCKRAVLVGTALSVGQPAKKTDGLEARTLWGEMAWQLGGKAAYALVADSDRSGTSPGSDILTDLLKKHAPCLVLIDEWVAFVRQLYHVSDQPAGSFDANMTFVQTLTEAAKRVPGVMIVASLPASQIEIGGEGGQAALDRLKNTFSRVRKFLAASNCG